MTWYYWSLILALPVGYLRLVAHELSHAVACIVTGGTVDWKRFRPWPHRDDGRWRWGRMHYDGGNDMLVHLAPLGRATAFMVAWVPLSLWVWTPLWVCAAWELTDVLHWWRGWVWHPDWDGGKARALLREGKRHG